MATRVVSLFGLVLISAVTSAASPPQSVQRFLQRHCLDCHDGSGGEGDFDLQSLVAPDESDASMQRWVRLFDRVCEGEMPPPDASDVSAEELESFSQAAGDWLGQLQRDEHSRRGRVRARRLTNTQLERTLHDLLAIDIPLSELMPDEQRTAGFSNIADGQSMSHFQLASHLSVVDAALDEAFRRAADSDETSTVEFSVRKLCRDNPRQRCRDPEMLNGSAVVWSSSLIFYGRITSTRVPESGWYQITFAASAVKKPKDRGVWCTVRSGHCSSGAPLMSWIGSFEATEQPIERTFRAWIPAGQMLEIRPGDETLKRARFRGGQVGAGEGGPQNVPGVALHGMTIQRIHPGGDVATVRQRLLGEMKVKVQRGKLVSVDRDPASAVAQQLNRFARRAFRRPVEEKQLASYVNMATDLIAGGSDPIDALRAGYRAILCSPRFLYFTEAPGKLDDHAVASRLSYFLWNSMPDQELFELAEAGKLRQPAVLRKQVRRMIAQERGERFIKDFASQWLDLVDINFTEPDRKLHRDFDIIVENAMLAETHTFLTDLLNNNKSVAALVDSDHTYLNSRLARFYGMEGIEGEAVRRVQLDAKNQRGGLMAHGSILKVTANGTNTSPVLRGIWVSERILGVPIPPPPASVPAIEPDIRGAKTIREQLQKHLADAQCANCHKKIDPPGFALENFDAAGRWRENYVAVDRGRLHQGAAVDASNKLADGRTFKDFQEFRQLLLDDVRPIARNVAEKMLIYATGAPITFADRQVVQQIADSVADDHYGMRSLLEAVACSSTFLSK